MSDLATPPVAEAARHARVDAIGANWRAGTGYPGPDAALQAFAWAFCRRNAAYRVAWDRLSVGELERDFGLREAWDPARDDPPPDAAWHDGWRPEPKLLRAMLVVEGALTGGRARVLEELRHQARAARYARLVERLGPLRIGNRARLLVQLRAWDGRRAGASDVELASVLFPAIRDRHCYPYSTARTRARHAWQEGERFVDGRFRLLAVAPDAT